MFHAHPLLRAVQFVNGCSCVFLSVYGMWVAHALLFGIKFSMLLNLTPNASSNNKLLKPVQSMYKSAVSFCLSANIRDSTPSSFVLTFSTVELINFTPFGRQTVFLRYCPNAVASK